MGVVDALNERYGKVSIAAASTLFKPDAMAEVAIELVLQQAEKLGEDWSPLL